MFSIYSFTFFSYFFCCLFHRFLCFTVCRIIIVQCAFLNLLSMFKKRRKLRSIESNQLNTLWIRFYSFMLYLLCLAFYLNVINVFFLCQRPMNVELWTQLKTKQKIKKKTPNSIKVEDLSKAERSFEYIENNVMYSLIRKCCLIIISLSISAFFM